MLGPEFLSKVLSPIEGIQLDPKSERLSEAERYDKFNAIAMDYMPPVAQAASGSTGTSGSTSSTTPATPATTATNTPPDDEEDEENDEEEKEEKVKKKTNPFQGLADGFNTYAAAIAQTDDEWWDEDENKTHQLGEFTVDFRPGKNSGADISKGKGEIESDITVGYGPDGKETKISRGIQASF